MKNRWAGMIAASAAIFALPACSAGDDAADLTSNSTAAEIRTEAKAIEAEAEKAAAAIAAEDDTAPVDAAPAPAAR